MVVGYTVKTAPAGLSPAHDGVYHMLLQLA